MTYHIKIGNKTYCQTAIDHDTFMELMDLGRKSRVHLYCQHSDLENAFHQANLMKRVGIKNVGVVEGPCDAGDE